MSFRGGGLPARAVGALFIVPFGAGLLIWPYGTLPLTALLIILAAREGAQIVGAISGGASAAWSATLLVVPLAALVAAGPVAAAMLWVLTLLTLVTAHLLRALRVKRGSVAPHARARSSGRLLQQPGFRRSSFCRSSGSLVERRLHHGLHGFLPWSGVRTLAPT